MQNYSDLSYEEKAVYCGMKAFEFYQRLLKDSDNDYRLALLSCITDATIFAASSAEATEAIPKEYGDKISNFIRDDYKKFDKKIIYTFILHKIENYGVI